MFDFSRLPNKLRILLPAIFIVVLGAAGGLFSNFAQYLLTQIVISCLVGAALVMIVGYARVIMLAASAMMAVGAYGSTILLLNAGLPYLATLPIALGAGLLAGLLLAIPAMRFRGHHLAMVTMVFQFLVIILIREGGDVTGGALGLRVPPIKFLGISPAADHAWLLFVCLAAAPAVALLGVLLATRFGKILRAIGDSEVGADAYGINIAHFRIAAFAICSSILAYAGALLAPGVQILDPESFGISHSIIALGYPIVGGVNSIWGGIIGGAVLRALPESLRSFGQYQELWVAALAIIVMVINPSGILGIAERLFPARTRAKLEIARSDVPDVSTSHQRATFHKYAINVERARKAYDGLVAVNDVTLNVQSSHIHGLIGPNGAGKTTLFNAISGFIPLDFGIISLFGERVDGNSSRSRIGHGVTRTFQNVAVFGHLSCLDNVIMGVGCNGIGHSVAASMHEACGSRQYRALRDRAIAALSEVGLQSLMDVPANRLSLGNQRRLEIARAIVSRPRLILLDEPVSGVSPEEQAQIAALLLGLNRDHGITMLVIEHDISFVRAVCHGISVMAAGRIIAEGKPESVIRLPEVRRQYFGEFDASAA